jgi:hypothetical protein
MPLGYKYAERDASTQINWAEVGKNLSDVLLEEKRVREEKKDAIDQGIRDSLNNLSNAPKGQNQDVNNVLSNFTDDMMQQELLDEKLLKSGKMDPKLWTLRHQNRKDGTDKVFKIGTVLQENSKTIMDGINNNEIQSALGFYNMGTIEELGNLNNIRITTDSMGDGRMGVSKYETKIIDGKEVRVLSKDTTPVDVLLNMIHYQPKKFDVETNTTNTVKSFGKRFQAVYEAASVSGAGTITELLGIDAMKKYPEYSGIVKEMNQAISDQIEGYFAGNSLNLVSVLGENTGNYNSDSFTYDKDLAAKDPKKILLKIDPRTQTPVMDDKAPNYNKQKEEASQWVRTNIMSKLDSEVKMNTTSQIQLQERRPLSEAEIERGKNAKEAEAAAGAWNQLYTGKTPAEKKVAADILLGTPQAKKAGLIDIDLTNPGAIKLSYSDPVKDRTINYLDKNNRPISLRDFAGLGVELHGVVDRDKAMKAGGGGKGYGDVSDLSEVRSSRQGKVDTSQVTVDLFTSKSEASSERLKGILPDTFTVTDVGGVFGNNVEVIAPNGKKYRYNANVTAEKAATEAIALQNFINANSKTAKSSSKVNTTVKGGKPR